MIRARSVAIVALALPVALTACPALLSDWTIAGTGGSDAGDDSTVSESGTSGSGGGSGSASSGAFGSSGSGTSSGSNGAGGSSGSGGTGSDASVDAAACVTDLSGVGTGDLQIAFTLTTTDVPPAYMALLNQRTHCDDTQPGWDVWMTAAGDLGIEVFDGAAGSYDNVTHDGRAVNDGAPHHIAVSRSGGGTVLTVSIDGVARSYPGEPAMALGALAPLDTGTDPTCTGVTPISGQLFDVCITRSNATGSGSGSGSGGGTGSSGASSGGSTSGAVSSSGSSSGSSGSSGSASSGGSASSSGAGGDAGCAQGAVRCLGLQPQTCVSGVWLGNGAACSSACLDGACVACSPGSQSCASMTLPETCGASGAWTPGTACSGATPLCSGGACSAVCCKFSPSDGGTVNESCSTSAPWWCTGGQTYTCTQLGNCSLGTTCYDNYTGTYGGVIEVCP